MWHWCKPRTETCGWRMCNNLIPSLENMLYVEVVVDYARVQAHIPRTWFMIMQFKLRRVTSPLGYRIVKYGVICGATLLHPTPLPSPVEAGHCTVKNTILSKYVLFKWLNGLFNRNWDGMKPETFLAAQTLFTEKHCYWQICVAWFSSQAAVWTPWYMSVCTCECVYMHVHTCCNVSV